MAEILSCFYGRWSKVHAFKFIATSMGISGEHRYDGNFYFWNGQHQMLKDVYLVIVWGGYVKWQAEWWQRALHEYRGGNMRLGLAMQLERGELEASGNMEHF